MAYLSLQGINKIYPNGFHAVHDFNLDIEKGEFIGIIHLLQKEIHDADEHGDQNQANEKMKHGNDLAVALITFLHNSCLLRHS